MFLTNGMRYIYCWWITLLFIKLVLFEDLGSVNLRHGKYIYMRNALIIDVAIGDFNWYVVMLIFTTILIWDDVVNGDHVNMNWCYYWWLCQYGLRLLWLLVMSLKWNVDDVENALTSACCVCSWGAECTDLVGWPICGGQAWLKNLSIRCGDA